jgi:hypothetical protein
MTPDDRSRPTASFFFSSSELFPIELLLKQACSGLKEISYGVPHFKGGRMDSSNSENYAEARRARHTRHDVYSDKNNLLHGEKSQIDDAGSGPNSPSDVRSGHRRAESSSVRRRPKVRSRKQHASSDGLPLLLAEERSASDSGQGYDKRSKQSGQKAKTAQGASAREPSSSRPMFRGSPSLSSGGSANSPTARKTKTAQGASPRESFSTPMFRATRSPSGGSPNSPAAQYKASIRQQRDQIASQYKRYSGQLKEFRTLMCDRPDAEKIDRFIKSIFKQGHKPRSNVIMLAALTTPIEDINNYVNEAHFDTAIGLYKKYSNKDLAGKLERASPEKYFRVRQHLLTLMYKKLTEEDRKRIKETSFMIYKEALKTPMPALHAAIYSGNATAVGAYLKAVLKYAPRSERLELLEMKDEYGRSALHTALIHGSPEVIQTYMDAIIASDLPHQTKMNMFYANRTDGVGAFYLTMGAGNTKRAEVFIKSVLKWGIQSNEQMSLLLSGRDPVYFSIPSNKGRISNFYRSRRGIFPKLKDGFPANGRLLARFTNKHETVAMFDALVKSALSLEREAKKVLLTNCNL